MSGRGPFAVLEGGEGAGKSTVQRELAARLEREGHRVVATREPGGTPLGERTRELLLGHTVDPMAELLLFEAARAQLVAEIIRPALDRGDVVICDRFAASSIAYQAYGRGIERAIVEQANALATAGCEPDIILLLDIDVKEGLARRSGEGGGNRFDRESIEFHQRVRDGFLQLAAEDPARWRIVAASQPVARVVDECYGHIDGLLAERP